MTERWRKKLGDLDRQGPTDDVFERAQQGPTRQDEPLPRMKPSARLMTALAAFAVFAIAISVFAIPALRMQGDVSPGSSGSEASPATSPLLQAGEEHGGLVSVGVVLASASAQWVTFDGEKFVATLEGQKRRLLGPAPRCSSGTGVYEVREDGTVGISCPNGPKGTWSFSSGKADAMNPPAFSSSLASYPARLSSDGQLLVRFPHTVASATPSAPSTP